MHVSSHLFSNPLRLRIFLCEALLQAVCERPAACGPRLGRPVLAPAVAVILALDDLVVCLLTPAFATFLFVDGDQIVLLSARLFQNLLPRVPRVWWRWARARRGGVEGRIESVAGSDGKRKAGGRKNERSYSEQPSLHVTAIGPPAAFYPVTSSSSLCRLPSSL